MLKKKIIFGGGLHRSGTSLLHEILRSHPEVSGFENTGVPEDEGQHLQTVYLPAKAFGRPGSFGFNKMAFMDENHPLATEKSSEKIFQEWSKYWDLNCQFLIEKSPPNLLRTRFLQKIFPNSFFIIILRHPIAVSYATRKWSTERVTILLEHTLRCYEQFRKDMPYLSNVYVLRYEDFVANPNQIVHDLFTWLDLEPIKLDRQIKQDVNSKYFDAFMTDQLTLRRRLDLILQGSLRRFEDRANIFGYSLKSLEDLLEVSWLGASNRLFS
ncbi:MAG: sulfotransferase [Cyanobacteria bacterium J06635_10]